MAQLRPGQRQQGPAGVRRAHLGPEQPGWRQELLGQWISANAPPGRRISLQGRAGALFAEPRWRRCGLAARLAGSDSRPRHHRAPESRRPGDDDADRCVRAGVPHADERAGADRHPQRAAEDPRDVRHRAGPGLIRQQLPARATADRARRAIRAAVPPRMGHPRRLGRHRHRRARSAPLPRSRSGDWRAADGPETARAARHDARRLGRRVRPDADQRGAQRIEAARTRPPSTRVHDVDGGRRHEGLASRSDAPTISATTSSKIRWTSTICTRRCCTCSGSTTRS